MTQTKNKEIKADFQFKGIEVLKGALNLPVAEGVSMSIFNFDINLESRVDPAARLVFVVVNVDIRTEDQMHTLGSLAVSCIYIIDNFDEIIKLNAENKFEMPQPLTDTLNSISVSTTRGVMFATFKGTFLHNAFLPVIDSHQVSQ